MARFAELRLGYIGLADCYWLGPDPTPEPKEYLLTEAGPTLDDRTDVPERTGGSDQEQGASVEAAMRRQQAEA
jgi:hypothetical protein